MTPEGEILKGILDYLAAVKVWAMRINTGAVVSEYKGKTRFHRYGRPGCADILATTFNMCECGGQGFVRVIWIEVKTATGKQSDAQLEFQKEVENEGHTYIVARSIDDVRRLFE